MIRSTLIGHRTGVQALLKQTQTLLEVGADQNLAALPSLPRSPFPFHRASDEASKDSRGSACQGVRHGASSFVGRHPVFFGALANRLEPPWIPGWAVQHSRPGTLEINKPHAARSAPR